MIDYFEKYLSDTRWLFFENTWYPELQNFRETLFSLGNGYIGHRAILEEVPPGARPGTFFAGLYEGTRSLVPELINAPNPINFKISTSGEKLGIMAMQVARHKRVLDIRRGSLVRKTIYITARKNRIDYQSMRFFSMSDKNLAVMRIYLKPLDEDTNLTFTNNIDDSVANMGLITEGTKRHTRIVQSLSERNLNCIVAKTIEKETLISYASLVTVKKGRKTIPVDGWSGKFRVKKGESVCITNYISFLKTDNSSVDRIKSDCIRIVRKALKRGFDKLFSEHRAEWKKKWENSDIEISGDFQAERAVRFNIYHLLIAACEKCPDVSVGAKALTGEGYRGHIFWDSEIFCLPFFIYTNPKAARNMLLYRYKRLDAARKIARKNGYGGAMFPWESADTGGETTPSWYKDANGKIQRVLTMEQECHITADIAYAVNHYYEVTNDQDFMAKYGLEIMLEASRFWASRVQYDKRTKQYDINKVIGPDEFHENVNNNAYTNILAQWVLKTTTGLFKVFKKEFPSKAKKLISKIDFKEDEIKKWINIASRISVSYDEKRKIIEQFDGYFKKKKLPLTETGSNSLPLSPKARNLNRTQYVKQADVLMILYLLSDSFKLDKKKRNYHYYEQRTLHKSSLSASIHSALAAEIGEMHKALRYFDISVFSDLKDTYGNTASGIHAASLGGTWQATVMGFAGIRVRKGVLSIDPKLPPKWRKFKTKIKYHNYDLILDISNDKVTVAYPANRKKDRLELKVFGVTRKVCPDKFVNFRKPAKSQGSDSGFY